MSACERVEDSTRPALRRWFACRREFRAAVRTVEQVQQDARALDVLEEEIAEARAVVCAFH